MPDGWRWLPVGYDTPEKEEEDAEVGPLVRPSTMVKLSDLECPLPSLVPLVEAPAYGCGGGLLLRG